MTQQTNSRSQLYTLIVVFFFWGFIAASNGIFIPFCKSYFQLSQFQSQLIDLTFYGGYFIGSLVLFLFSRSSGVDLLNKIGYKKGIVYGLIVSAIGALAIIPSIHIGSYALILGSYFIIALGFSLQQTCAWPFIIALGTPETGAHRSNLAGSVNSLGTTIGPLIVSYVLFGGINGNGTEISLASISSLYAGVTALFLLMGLFFAFSKLPEIKNEAIIEKGAGALKYPQLTLGMIAIFVYVGVEVSIQSNLGALLKLPEFGGYDASQISQYISLYWGSLMIGRWTASISVFNLSKTTKKILGVVVPYLAFAIVLGVNSLHGNDISGLYIYAGCIALMIIANFIAQEKQARSLLIFSLFGFLAMLIGLFTTGQTALFAFISGGLACSILWPCIFSLAINGLGKYASQGSSFLIMMILGGAIIPPFQGKLADMPSIGIHTSYFIALLCFVYLAFYAIKAKSILKKQGIDEDAVTVGTH